jgi:hypothetical protein
MGWRVKAACSGFTQLLLPIEPRLDAQLAWLRGDARA